MDSARIPFMSLEELAHAIRDRAFSSVAALEAFISRVELLNPALNAVVVFDYTAARSRARRADAALARGELWGPLHGVPFTVKENNDVRGLPSSVGDPANANNIAPESEVMIERVVEAGGIIFGKTNLPIGAMDIQSYNPVYGSSSNPWRLDRTPGGSSGGSAAAVAAYLTPFELGGDIGGSIRIPAAFCGVYGHKPTFGLIPRRGPSTSLIPPEVSVKGPLARTAADLSLVLQICAGPDRSNVGSRGWVLDLPQPTKHRLSEFKVAVWADDLEAPVDDQLVGAAERVGHMLKVAGCQVDFAARPNFDTKHNTSLWYTLTAGDRSATGRTSVTLRDYRLAREKQVTIREAWEDFFKLYDVLIVPSHSSAAFTKDESEPPKDRKVTISKNGSPLELEYHQPLFWAFLTNVGLLPSTTFPCGTSREGLPLGLNVVSREWNDLITIDFARLLKTECGLQFTAPPEYSESTSSSHSRL